MVKHTAGIEKAQQQIMLLRFGLTLAGYFAFGFATFYN